jgi:peptidoglycan/xylan/chitin deacetylase (PgdA/CDA1 family)
MRNAGTATFLVLFTVLTAHPGQAAEGCANTLGVSRTIEIDAKGGPWFGAPQGDPNFLAPGEVVLTFDDGPAPLSTRPILAALAAECTKATFFVLGEMAIANPDVIREIDAQGHTLGTHTWSHPNLKRLAEEKMKAQIESAFTAVETGAGHPIAPFFRYPYLSYTQASAAYLQSRNIAQFAIDIDSFDWRTRNPQSVIRQVEASLSRHGRGIILLHDIHPSTAAAVPGLLALLKTKGFKVAHLRPKTSLETLAAYPAPSNNEPRYAGASRRRVVAHTSPTKPWLTSWKWPAW